MEQLGIEPTLLLAQVVNFAIIVVVLSKLLYTPILGMLEKRKAQIEEGIAGAERIKQEEAKLASRKEKLLLEARKEGHVILEEARKLAKEEEKQIIAQAHTEAEEIIAKGRVEVEALREKLMVEVRRESTGLGVAIAKRLLDKALGSQQQHAILGSHIKNAESLGEKYL
ncbi:ATP synthase F0 subunit B [Candidatus Gottesmanbacteria bacterium RIFCSPHIGHO2_01_FULL_46_14]|uniref:ATP synthase subunit b n=1 Tax=Candidatus Gottesmanbacteria bacterium RIFCSPHIGHO2_01_FULL_46_14 TaxID=1798380 RepID=A0A1F5ZLA8_9BACT|nr:MAG: ATP synthase F0 subunit B [Candidatus Gottesmanbacteria bacterium RIFCSPHIGHO2_01_FULL_46_14]